MHKLLQIVLGLLLLILLPILTIIGRLFRPMVEIMCSRSIRIRSGRLQTPVRFYAHPGRERRAVVVGTIHIAEPAYYRRLLRLIIAFEQSGGQVVYEGLGRLPAEQTRTLSPDEQMIRREFEALFAGVAALAAIMGLTEQRDGLPRKKTWKNTDLTQRQLIERFVQTGAHLVDAATTERLLAKLRARRTDPRSQSEELLLQRWVINFLFRNIVPAALLYRITELRYPARRRARRIILQERSDIGAAGLRQALKNGSALTIWGAAHAGDLESDLRRTGYHLQKTLWLTAYHTRREPTLSDILRARTARHEAAKVNGA